MSTLDKLSSLLIADVFYGRSLNSNNEQKSNIYQKLVSDILISKYHIFSICSKGVIKIHTASERGGTGHIVPELREARKYIMLLIYDNVSYFLVSCILSP